MKNITIIGKGLAYTFLLGLTIAMTYGALWITWHLYFAAKVDERLQSVEKRIEALERSK